jgi:hypothetical protein
MSELLRLILTPHTTRHGQFVASLDGEVVCVSDQPLFDGARELLQRGYHPAARLTTRHLGKPYDNFVPARLDRLAKWTVSESDRDGLQYRKYTPRPTPAGSPISAEVQEGPPPS